jgi:hypothetical protein
MATRFWFTTAMTTEGMATVRRAQTRRANSIYLVLVLRVLFTSFSCFLRPS